MDPNRNDAFKAAAKLVQTEFPAMMTELVNDAELYPNYITFTYNHEKLMVPKVSRKEFKNNCEHVQAKVASCIQECCDNVAYDYILEFTVNGQLVRTFCNGGQIYQKPSTYIDILYYTKDPRKVKDVSEKRKRRNRHNIVFLVCFGIVFLFVIAVTILRIINS